MHPGKECSADFPYPLEEVAMTQVSGNITQTQTLEGASVNGIRPTTNHTLHIRTYLVNIRYSELVPQKIAMNTSWLKKCQTACNWIGYSCSAVYSRPHRDQKKHKNTFVHCSSESDSQADEEGG